VVCLGKFKLSEIAAKIKAYPKTVLSTATAMTDMSIEQTYQLCFFAINGFITGEPDSKHKLVWHTLIERVVDKDSTCDDAGWVGMKVVKRVKLIRKEKPLSIESINWIEKELKPYFVDSLKKQKSDLGELMFKHIVDEPINSEESKKFYDIYQKKQGMINRLVKK